MARSKHSKALFEVISSSNREMVERRGREGLVRRLLARLDRRSSIAAATAPAPQATSAPAAPAVKVAVDPERQQIAFRLSYSSAAIAGFAVVTAVALGVLVGRHQAPQRVLAPVSTEQVRQQAPQPGVLDVPAPQRTAGLPMAAAVTGDGGNGIFVDGLPRTINANYVIAQTYPDEKSAAAARDVLIQNGIACTVETKLYFAPTWFSVVGDRGFLSLRNAEYENYVKRIEAVSAGFAGRSKFKKFEPHAFKWKG